MHGCSLQPLHPSNLMQTRSVLRSTYENDIWRFHLTWGGSAASATQASSYTCTAPVEESEGHPRSLEK